jgi:hypothetical protein
LGSTSRARYVGPTQAGTDLRRAATFRVTYSGFTPAARAAFQSAVNVWATKVTSTVPITVKATFVAQPANQLGSAGSSFIWRDFPGAPRRATWYVDAIANKRAGRQMDPAAAW